MSSPVILCRDLRKQFDTKVAVAGIDLEVEAGTCQGLLGPNGAGKTTTVEMLEGLSPPTSGTIELFGNSWGQGRDTKLRRRIGAQLQETILADKLHVDEVLTLFRSFYPKGRDVAALLTLLGLTEVRHQEYCRLSGGQKQRVAVATALVGAPDLLFLDEPTTGLDPRARHALWEVVRDFRSQGGTVLLTTHYMEEAAELCDSIAIMDQGHIIARGTPRALIDGLGDVQFLEFELNRILDQEPLRRLPGVQGLESRKQHYRVTLDRSLVVLRSVLFELERQGLVPIGLSTHQATLDDVFLQLTGRGLTPDGESTEELTAVAS
jgi:ABC-2 type transport system ATP-binding protein